MKGSVVTAVDSSVLLDVLTDDPVHRARSLEALRKARQAGALLVCPIVWAEVRGFFEDPTVMHTAFSEAGIAFDLFDQECADLAGTLWHKYRRSGGSRTRLIADFLIGAHAQARGGRLLTRDRGFYRRYFSLELL
ncbi:MAG: type II toxin-antitoxin system VapC family toxin [Acidobacteriota bacterium]